MGCSISRRLQPCIVDENTLPSAKKIIFSQSTFFIKHGRALPSPDEVRSKAKNKTKIFSPDPVQFPEMGLLVKWGTDITEAEGQCMWFMREWSQGRVPVPEIYGWHREDGITYIYMELVRGDTLDARWPELALVDRKRVRNQLNRILKQMRRLRRHDHSEKISTR